MKKLIRRILLASLAGTMVLGVTAAPAVAEDVKLKLWSGGYSKEGQRAVRTVISEFEAANPGIKIEYTPWAWDKYRVQLNTSATLGDAPDMWLDGFYMKWKKAGMTVDNADLYAKLPPEEVAAFSQTYIKFLKDTVGLVSFPHTGIVWTVGYNKEIFAERGIEVPTEPISLEQLKELSSQLTFDRDGDGKIDVYGYALLGGRVSSHFFNVIYRKLGGQWTDPQGNLIADQYRDQFIEALVFMREMAEYTPGGATAAVGRSYDGVRALFAKERVALTFDVGELESVLRSLAPEVAEKKLGFLKVDFGMIGIEGVIIGKTDHRDEALEYVKFVTARDQLVRINDALGTITPRNDVSDHPIFAGKDNTVILGEQFALPSNVLHPGDMLPTWGELRPALWDAIAEVLFGGDPSEAADKAIAKMTNQFKQ